jgi:hypothetical protein
LLLADAKYNATSTTSTTTAATAIIRRGEKLELPEVELVV